MPDVVPNASKTDRPPTLPTNIRITWDNALSRAVSPRVSPAVPNAAAHSNRESNRPMLSMAQIDTEETISSSRYSISTQQAL